MSKIEIEDIFSKRKEQEKKQQIKIEIILDTREKQSLIASNLRELGARIRFEKLDIADYLIGDVAIERKTFQDFQASIIDKRLHKQLIELKKYEKRLLLLEGFFYNYKEGRINENALRGALLSVMLSLGIPIIFTENEKDTAKFLIAIAKKQENPKKTEPSLRPLKNVKTLEEQKQFILEGFPGIGATSAKNLIKEYENLEKIFLASEIELKERKIIDGKIISKMKEILKS